MINKLLTLYQASCTGMLHKTRGVATSLTWNNKLLAIRYGLYTCIRIHICVHICIFDTYLILFLHVLYIHVICMIHSLLFCIRTRYVNININIFSNYAKKHNWHNYFVHIIIRFANKIYLNLTAASIKYDVIYIHIYFVNNCN